MVCAVLYCNELCRTILHYAPGDRLYDCLSVCLSVRPSVCLSAASTVEECEADSVQVQEQGEQEREGEGESRLKDVLLEIPCSQQVPHPLLHIFLCDRHDLPCLVRGVKGHLLHDAFNDCVEPPCSNVLY